jgi:hypothetical protein
VRGLFRAAWGLETASQRKLRPDGRVVSGEMGMMRRGDRPSKKLACAVGDWVLVWPDGDGVQWTPYRYFVGAFMWLERRG